MQAMSKFATGLTKKKAAKTSKRPAEPLSAINKGKKTIKLFDKGILGSEASNSNITSQVSESESVVSSLQQSVSSASLKEKAELIQRLQKIQQFKKYNHV